VGDNGAEAEAAPAAEEPELEPETVVAVEERQPEPSGNGAEPATDDYVPMSEWLDDLDA
jgi:hypothetical protein